MRYSVLRLLQLYDLLCNASPVVDVNDYSDLIVCTLYLASHDLDGIKMRKCVDDFVMIGFNPFSPKLSDFSKIHMKSVIAKCDSIIKKGNKHGNTRYC